MSSIDAQKTALVTSVQILSDLFWGPTLQNCGKILSGAYVKPFATLASSLALNPPDVLQRITSGLRDFTDLNSLFQDLEATYVRLFISHRDGIAAPLYESCYIGVEPGATAPLMGEPALRMKQRFESKGLSLDSSIKEPPDHLAIELEFLYFLLKKGWSDNDGNLIVEASSFSRDSMLPWVSRLHQRLADVASEGSFYLLITIILCAILKYIGKQYHQISQNSRAM